MGTHVNLVRLDLIPRTRAGGIFYIFSHHRCNITQAPYDLAAEMQVCRAVNKTDEKFEGYTDQQEKHDKNTNPSTS